MAIKLAPESKDQIIAEARNYKNGNDEEQERAYAYLHGVLAVAYKNDGLLADYVKAVLDDDDGLFEWDEAWPDPNDDDIDAELHATLARARFQSATNDDKS